MRRHGEGNYDWSGDYSDEQSGGTTTFTSSTGETVDVTVAQPDPSNVYRFNRDGFETNTQGDFSGGHFEAGLNFTNNSQTVTQTIDFSNNTQSSAGSVTDVSFVLFDSLYIRRQGLRWMSSDALHELGLLKNPKIYG